MITPDGFSLGWNHNLEAEARAKWAKSGQPFKFGAPQLAFSDAPLPNAFSLSNLIQWHFDQGPVGTCYANAGTQEIQITTAADNVQDGKWELFQGSRAFTAHNACRLDSGGSRYDVTQGGSIANTLRGLDESGCCHESLLPYYPSGWTPQNDGNGRQLGRWLNGEPPTVAAVAEGKIWQLGGTVDCKLGDEAKRLIVNGHPPEIGIWWPYGWDSAVDSTGRVTGIGRGQYGHALVLIGYHSSWDNALWWEIENSHGPIYHPIPANIQAEVVGYKSATPTASYSFWVRDDMLHTVFGYGNAECVASAGVQGFREKPALLEWGGMLS